jgi:class 3 adenylate cyclase/tetratricopeptide (TPR) repeat protein
MQVCPECARENPDGFLHCGFCTASLAASPSGRRRLATLVFCDVVGSTALGERVDPEPLQELMRMYFAEMRDALERHGGSVEKFIGDAVVGVFGVPRAHEDDALRACRAALEMQARLASLAPELDRRFGTGIEVRIGINSGEVVGSRETFVTGDAVNVAARLEQAARPGEVLLGETTWRLVRHAVRADPVEPVAAKGKAEPLAAYRLLEAGWPGLRAATPLLGRRAELELLEHELAEVVAGRACRLATVAGEPGVGKSRLADELVAGVEGRARVVRGACLSYGEGITFWPVAQIVRELAGIRDDDSADDARAKVPRRIAQLLGLVEGTASASQTIAAIAAFLADAAGAQPLVVLVDDIHWAEPALLELVAALPSAIGNAPVFVLCLARPDLLEARPDWPVAIALEPLGPGDVDALLERLETPPSVRVRIALAAAGNPLFAEELVAWAHEGGDVDALPTTLNALLGSRLDRLQAEERDALERGAVEGELFHRSAVVELSEEAARPAVDGGLDALTRKDMIRLTAAMFAGEAVAYRFKHVLVREAAYRATGKKVRAGLHERYADWLERRVGARIGEYEEVIGYHLEQAYLLRAELGPLDAGAGALATRAARHLGAGGRRAATRGDHRAAQNLLERALRLRPPETADGVELLRLYGTALNNLGRVGEFRRTLEEVLEYAAALGDRALVARVRGSLVGDRLFSVPNPDYAAERAILEESMTVLAELGDISGVAAQERHLGLIARLEGRIEEAAVWLERARAHAAASDDQWTSQQISRSLSGILVAGPMAVDEAIARCNELYADTEDDRVAAANIASCLSVLHAMAGRFDEARAHGHVADGVYGNVDSMFAALGQTLVSARWELLGDRDGAERAQKARWRFFKNSLGGAPDGRAVDSTYMLARICCDDGRWEEARGWLAHFAEVGRKDDSNRESAIRMEAEAQLAVHGGEPERALELARRATELTDRFDDLNARGRAWRTLALVHRAAGRSEEADAATETAIAYYEQKGNVTAAGQLRAAVSI